MALHIFWTNDTFCIIVITALILHKFYLNIAQILILLPFERLLSMDKMHLDDRPAAKDMPRKGINTQPTLSSNGSKTSLEQKVRYKAIEQETYEANCTCHRQMRPAAAQLGSWNSDVEWRGK